MKRSGVFAVLGAALLLASAAGARTGATGGHGILLVHALGRQSEILLWRPGLPLRRVGPSADLVESPQWSPDGKSIAFADEKGGWDTIEGKDKEIYVMRANGSKVRRLTFDTRRHGVLNAFEPSWSPDGRRILYLRDHVATEYRDLAVIDVRTGKEKTLIGKRTIGSPVWGRAGIAYVLNHHRVMLLRRIGDRPEFLGPTPSKHSALAWSSRNVLAALGDNRVVLYSALGYAGEFLIPSKASGVCGMAWSPDGKRLLMRTGGVGSRFWTVTSAGTRWRRFSGPLPAPAPGLGCAVSWR